jgi:hypothetical protein
MVQMTQAVVPLSELAVIPAEYEHAEKPVVPADDFCMPGVHLKWYDITPVGTVTPPEIRAEAQGFLRAENAAGRLEFGGELGYAMLHLDGGRYFLIVCIWRDVNELWQVLYGRYDNGFESYPQKKTALKPTQNIYELDTTAHERRAWSRYLSSARDDAAKRAYIEDRTTGVLV